MDIIKKNKNHMLFGAVSSGLFYVTGVINENQLIPFFIGSAAVSYVGKEFIFNNRHNDSQDTQDSQDIDPNIGILTPPDLFERLKC